MSDAFPLVHQVAVYLGLAFVCVVGGTIAGRIMGLPWRWAWLIAVPVGAIIAYCWRAYDVKRGW
jgi:hypothetical protein